MKPTFEFDDDSERELFLTTVAIGMGFFSSSLDDIEANVQSVISKQLTQLFVRGQQMKKASGDDVVDVKSFTTVDIKALSDKVSDQAANGASARIEARRNGMRQQ